MTPDTEVKTELLYLSDFTLVECEAKVMNVTRAENGKTIVVLDQTAFYPQGGGQPYDKGTIESVAAKFVVDEVRFMDGIVHHIGNFEHGALAAGETVKCSVDKERRQLHTRLHSAGHVVDMAVDALGLEWIPGKGYHFPDGPYVEYEGNAPESEREAIKAKIEEQVNAFIRQGRDTSLQFMNRQQMKAVCRHVPDYIPENKPSRVVLYGDFGVPCGGTHVTNLSQIGKIVIRKIKQDGSKVKVAYAVE